MSLSKISPPVKNWLRQNLKAVTIIGSVIVIDNYVEYLWLKPLYPDGVPPWFWAIIGLTSLSASLWAILQIDWHKK